METVVTRTDVYSFSELSEGAKQNAMQWYCQNMDSLWSECVIDDAKEIASIMGWSIENVYWSGFRSQGDGAQFEGALRYAKGCAKNVKGYAPKDTELHRIAQAWQDLQKRNVYALRATVKSTGRYSHEYCTAFACEDERENSGYLENQDSEESIIEIARDFMRWIYRHLERAYDYETSEENIAEMCHANGWRFTEDGDFLGVKNGF